MGRFKDLTGQKFGRLTVLRKATDEEIGDRDRKRGVFWCCQCDCGNTELVIVPSVVLKSGHTQSCGCIQKEKTSKHGLSNSRIYSIWSSMKDRCLNPNHHAFNCYGGRGITICKEWMDSFESFHSWALENGYKEGLTIDRIDVNGNYEPSNCRWVTMKEQGNNRRTNHLVTFNGKTLTMSQWCEELNVPPYIVKSRINQHKWSIEQALTTPYKCYTSFKDNRQELKEEIRKRSRNFNGKEIDKQIMKVLNLTKSSYYKLKNELKNEILSEKEDRSYE